MTRFITARQAANLIPDGATVAVAGMGISGWAEEIGRAIRDSFVETGHPRELTLKQGCDLGDFKDRGVDHLGEAGPGLVKKWCGGHTISSVALMELAAKNELGFHCLPQGVIVNLWREIGAGRPGLLTKVGLGTFVDPRISGGRMNEAAMDKLVELVAFGGEEYLFYKSFKLDVAVLRGSVADENGNITFENESMINEGYSVANAAKNCGGIVIVQVDNIAKSGTLNPKNVKIPGVMVDYVVKCTDDYYSWQTELGRFEPAFSGQIKKPMSAIAPMPFDERKVICRRCAMELRRGYIINLGVGIPSSLSRIVAEEGFVGEVSLSGESGVIGGVTARPNCAYNPDAFFSHNEMFDFIDGGGLDMTCLGIGQIDRFGNNNVSKFADKLSGPGGFINISTATPKVVFCGTLRGKAKLKVGNGKISVLQEGPIQKFVQEVDQITFSGGYKKDGQKVLYVTERCVFELRGGRMTLIEIAPGLDLQRDILDQIGFMPEIPPDLKLMDESIFREEWGGLEAYIS